MTVAILLCALGIIIVACIASSTHLGKGNLPRHITNEYHFAHFSHITRHNYWLYPEFLLLTHPTRLTLDANMSLCIPAGWWHWIETLEPSIAINFWTTDASYTQPLVLHETYQDPELLSDIERRVQGRRVMMWKSDIDIMETSDFTGRSNNMYMITLPGYEGMQGHMNNDLLDSVKPRVVIPPQLRSAKQVDINLWVSAGYHDTGLHYDDYDGILTVLSGRKRIVLYPPEDAPHLRAISVVPAWAAGPSIWFEPNAYHLRGASGSSIPGARLLYETMQAHKFKPGMLWICNLLKGDPQIAGRIVWGCKMDLSGSMRWELYFYHYSCHDASAPQDVYPIATYTPVSPHAFQRVLSEQDENVVIHSFDMQAGGSNVVDHDTMHVYRRDASRTEKNAYPFYGIGLRMTLEGGEVMEHPESVFVMDRYDSFVDDIDNITASLGVNEIAKASIKASMLPCQNICCFNKVQNTVLVVMCGISASDFISFLDVHGYPQSVLDHVRQHKRDYDQLWHEVGIGIDTQSGQVIRTALYGIL